MIMTHEVCPQQLCLMLAREGAAENHLGIGRLSVQVNDLPERVEIQIPPTRFHSVLSHLRQM
jgi:hypothetical protein